MSTTKSSLTADRLRALLVYDADTGLFKNRVTRNNRAKAGDSPGYTTWNGYLSIALDGRGYQAHRLAWLYVHGTWPTQFIDHINGNRQDNRIANLRDVIPQVNRQNMRAPMPSNSAGLIGVTPVFNQWKAQIKLNGRQIYLGLFETPEAAHAAYVAAKRKHHPGCTI
jgi:hypothetical protein